ncbi:MAG TPA: cytochrome c oxidase accessory protein CcoG [Plasticicumulans sp.]|uniref:cytochrome c oxidase accessory protein CcoG n=1 Tax=Plasticicumulans sp. TaxID=2307179 RepID=UPI000F9359C5|nr:cytochrome c oxidase accessory protein CcoG [Plasticicumulans sp.]RTL01211.1 MAG: cytochrome c oxidase accessory protein CcoG [Xanthomonadales bacterium]HMV39193.1 cytochrome c oxidase accessory protein CcoG [Plasticicumulans sp.]HMW30394.1 cytochrome c oxidase accessory protein CcoG [Plasticicumulans sp.]HMX53278.1 cytochrome c oxidase accessory protein CcoG [Plasticicumulans sp.]HMZ11228.1 cytochrome c oxidase accessory protein CcoG [Plasticicumulans sp.]
MTAETPSRPEGQDSGKSSFYAKTAKIYAREVKGRFATLRIYAVFALLGLYYGLPWLPWDGRQAVLFDLPARKFYIFGWVFWPQDFFFLALLLIIAALALFFFTALAGRLWCGYACPQTVWTETFMWIEHWVEGDRNARMKLDKAPWSAGKFRKKLLKHSLWALFALWTGFTFVGFFTPMHDLAARLWPFDWGPWETFWVFFYAFATWGNAGFMREQVCLYMCPYARFQSAMFDKDTLVISYDAERGEPRGSRKRGTDPKAAGLGSCVDCTMCVQVCPTGIDIRNGLQYQCIGCAACIDACDDIMDKMNYPRGLIRYTTEHSLMHDVPHVIRPRMMVYGGLLLALTIGLLVAIALRVPLQLDVIRDRNALYRMNDEGLVENVYTLKIINMDEREHRYRLGVSGVPGLKFTQDPGEIRVGSGEVFDLPTRVSADPEELKAASNEIRFDLVSVDAPKLKTVTAGRFLGPARH